MRHPTDLPGGKLANRRTFTSRATASMALLLAASGCDSLTALNGDGGDLVLDPNAIRLIVDNRLGAPVVVEAVFRSGAIEARRTMRYIAAGGVDATVQVIPTVADRLELRARRADGPGGGAGNTLVREALLSRDADFAAGETVRWVIEEIIEDEAPTAGDDTPPDCNTNGTADAIELASGLLTDADTDAVPDECQPRAPIAGDVNCDGAIDADDVPPFVAVLLKSPEADTCDPARADVSGDGAMDGEDIQQFVELLMP